MAGLVIGVAFVVLFASGSEYSGNTKSSPGYYDPAHSGSSALLLINECTLPNAPSEMASDERLAIMERTWISVSKLNVQPHLIDDTPCTVTSSDLLSMIPKLEQGLKGADGCASGTEVCSLSYGMSSASVYPNGIGVGDSQDYELSLSKEEAEILAGSVPLANHLAILAYDDTFYLLAFRTTNATDVGAQVESQLEDVNWEPVRLDQGQILTYTLKIKTFATFGGPVNISLEAFPTARDSGIVVKLEPDVLRIDERSEAEAKIIIEAPSDKIHITPKEGIYEIYITGTINNSSLLHSPCRPGGQCPVIKIGDSKWSIRTYGNDSGSGMGGKDPPAHLAAEIVTDKQVYEQGENVVLEAYVVNKGNEPVLFNYVSMVLQIFDREQKGSCCGVYGFHANLDGPITIEPNSRTLLARDLEWDQKTFGYGMDPHPVHTGIYSVDLLFSGYEGVVFHDHKDIQIVGRGEQNLGEIDETIHGTYENATAIVIPKGASDPAETDVPYFEPQVSDLQAGAKFYWKNEDYVPHTATSSTPGSEDAGLLFDTMIIPSRQQSDVFGIETPGQYPYFCLLHPWMSGVIVVHGAEP